MTLVIKPHERIRAVAGASKFSYGIEFEIEAFIRESIFNDFDNFSHINSQYVKSKSENYRNLKSIPDQQRIFYLNKIKMKISKSNRSQIIPLEVIKGWEKL